MPSLFITASTHLPGLMPFLCKLSEFLVKIWQKQTFMVAQVVILHHPGKESEPG